MMRQDEREELALRKLLQRASVPELPEGSASRLMARLEVRPVAQTATVLAFKPRQTTKPGRWLLIGLPLAASLLLGIVIGSESTLDSVLPGQTQSADASNSLDLDPPQIELSDDSDGGLA